MSAKKQTEGKPRFTPNHDGLVKFLEAFQYIWAALKALYNGPVGHSSTTQDFIRQMEPMRHNCGKLLDYGEDERNTYKRAIALGTALMHRIEDYIEGVVELTRANEFYDRTCSEIDRRSPSVWNSRKEEIGQKHALFIQVDRGEDLEGVVMAYNQMVLSLNSALAEVKAEEDEREKQKQAETEARENLAKMEKNRKRGKSILSELVV